METAQRVVHRSGLFSRLLLTLFCLALLVFLHTLIRQNLPDRFAHRWPWKIQLLDVQSAVAVVLATGGASLAREQYARTVRPALGSFGRVRPELAPRDQLAWVCHLYNGGQEVVTVTDVRYRVAYTAVRHAQGARDSPAWVKHRDAVTVIESCGLSDRADFNLNSVTPGHPIPGQRLVFLGWFTEKAMREVAAVFVRVRVLDRVGDAHERVIDLLQDAERAPSHPDPPAPY
ncbi:hypothetical protein ACWDWS_04445 [Streptomyces sp. NPDC003328]